MLAILAAVALTLIVMCGGLFVLLVQPNIHEKQVRNRLQQLSLALHNYHDANHCYPAPHIRRQDGKLTQSWRVALLPYVEQDALYQKFDHKQPWDSPHNLKVAETMPEIFRSPRDTGPTNHTSFVVVAGRGTAFSANDPKYPGNQEWFDPGSFRDGLDTIGIVEVSNSGIVWTEPRDLDEQQLDYLIRYAEKNSQGQLNTNGKSGLLVATMNGIVTHLPPQTPAETVKALFTRAGGERIQAPR